MTKDQLRILYKQKRSDLSVEKQTLLNNQIFEKLKHMDWHRYNYVHVFLGIERFNEPNTAQFITWISEFFPHIHLIVSKSDFASGEMLNFVLDDQTILVENKWGILEPLDGDIVDEELIDLVLVPLLVADSFGHRVGYGKGFYDRFLSRCRKDVDLVGISFFEPIHQITDVGEWDVRLQSCITPSGHIYF